MHKRILCAILAAILLLSLIPAFVLPARAASNMKTSEACIAILKNMEGFAEFPYFDYEHYSVGYGSTCKETDYPDGITEEEADALLRQFLANMEGSLNSFATQQNILFSQYQFDALMLFTYNVGIGWMYGVGDTRQAVIDNATGNDFIYPFAQWVVAGGEVHAGLINRRLREANMYLNGSYADNPPANYTYVTYNNNGGTGNARIHGYDSNQKAPVKSRPTRGGYVFLGWYDAVQGGSWVRNLTASHAQRTIYAHWQPAGADPSAAAAASYQIPAAELMSLDTYETPGGEASGALNQEAMAVVEADYVDANGLKWGRLVSGRWVMLGDPLTGIAQEVVVEEGIKITITGDHVNVRTGPGTNYPVVAGVQASATVYISRVVAVEEVLWGKCRAGWLCLDYTDYAGGLPVEEPGDDIPHIPGTPAPPKKPEKKEEETILARGTVNVNKLSIRSAAGSRGTPVGSYHKGDQVRIYEFTKILGTSWGRTKKGWICLIYVDVEMEEGTEMQNPLEPTAPEETVPMEPEETPKGHPGTVVSNTNLKIRSMPGTGGEAVGSYTAGQKIWIMEQKFVDGILWGHTDAGWICMQYVRMTELQSEDEGIYGIVTARDGLSIRCGAGVGYAPVDRYPAGIRVCIREQILVEGRKWGRTDLGWICMEYVRLEGMESDAPVQTNPEETVAESTTEETEVQDQKPVTIAASVISESLNIRHVPGPAGDVLGHYDLGQKIQILEIRRLDGTAWGRTDQGWVCLNYVELAQTEQNETGFTVVITKDSLCYRQGPGTGNLALGAYNKGDAVIILEQTMVGLTRWGRTDKGWICMDYVE